MGVTNYKAKKMTNSLKIYCLLRFKKLISLTSWKCSLQNLVEKIIKKLNLVSLQINKQ